MQSQRLVLRRPLPSLLLWLFRSFELAGLQTGPFVLDRILLQGPLPFGLVRTGLASRIDYERLHRPL